MTALRPPNIRILAAQLERGGRPIGVLSTNHTTLGQITGTLQEVQARIGVQLAGIEKASRAILAGARRAGRSDAA